MEADKDGSDSGMMMQGDDDGESVMQLQEGDDQSEISGVMQLNQGDDQSQSEMIMANDDGASDLTGMAIDYKDQNESAPSQDMLKDIKENEKNAQIVPGNDFVSAKRAAK